MSRTRHFEQGRKRPSTQVVDACIDYTLTCDLDQDRRCQFGTIEFAQDHRKVGCFRVPGRFERGPQFDLRRAMGAANGEFPARIGGVPEVERRYALFETLRALLE